MGIQIFSDPVDTDGGEIAPPALQLIGPPTGPIQAKFAADDAIFIEELNAVPCRSALALWLVLTRAFALNSTPAIVLSLAYVLYLRYLGWGTGGTE